MSEHWTDRLSEYLDGELTAGEARELESHLAGCAACAGTLAELRAVVEAAAMLPDEPPARDLWPGIEARLTPRTAAGVEARVVPLDAGRRQHRRVAFTIPQLAAAGIALVVFSAAAVWLSVGGGAGSPVAQAPAPALAPAGAVSLAASWESAVADLETEFERRRATLDPETILVVERNLALIDAAIADARQALEADPSSGFLNGYVADAMRRKVDLLRQATRIQRTDI